MRLTGIVRKVDELGRIVIPIELRRTLHVDVGDAFEIYVDEERIFLKKYSPTCLFCSSAEELSFFRGKMVCQVCMHELFDLRAP